jgi:SOS-response transcriptional repressor LexA
LDAIKVIGFVQAGHWVEAIEWPAEEQTEINVPLPNNWPNLQFQAFMVRGESMNEIYSDGSIVIAVSTITYGFEPKSGDRVIVTRRDSAGLYEATVKEFWVDQRGKPWLMPRSSDPYFQTPVNFTDMQGDNVESVEVTGIVVGSFRIENPERFA